MLLISQLLSARALSKKRQQPILGPERCAMDIRNLTRVQAATWFALASIGLVVTSDRAFNLQGPTKPDLPTEAPLTQATASCVRLAQTLYPHASPTMAANDTVVFMIINNLTLGQDDKVIFAGCEENLSRAKPTTGSTPLHPLSR